MVALLFPEKIAFVAARLSITVRAKQQNCSKFDLQNQIKNDNNSNVRLPTTNVVTEGFQPLHHSQSLSNFQYSYNMLPEFSTEDVFVYPLRTPKYTHTQRSSTSSASSPSVSLQAQYYVQSDNLIAAGIASISSSTVHSNDSKSLINTESNCNNNSNNNSNKYNTFGSSYSTHSTPSTTTCEPVPLPLSLPFDTAAPNLTTRISFRTLPVEGTDNLLLSDEMLFDSMKGLGISSNRSSADDFQGWYIDKIDIDKSHNCFTFCCHYHYKVLGFILSINYINVHYFSITI